MSNEFNTFKMNKIIFSKVKRKLRVFNTIITLSYKKQVGEISDSVKTIKEKPVHSLNPEYNYLLHKNLKHLYFINFLEMNYNSKQLDKFPVDFLQSFQQVKWQAQKNTLTLIDAQAA